MPSKILVVDDDQASRDTLKGILARKGYEVVTASSSQEAIRLLIKEPIQLCITDMKMAGLDGSTLVTAIRKHHNNVAVIAVSGFPPEANAQKILDSQGVPFLSKPLDIVALTRLIKEALPSG